MSTVFQEGDVLPPSRTTVFKIFLYLRVCGGGSMETFMLFYLSMYKSIVMEDELQC